MRATNTLDFHGDRFRFRPWPGVSGTVALIPLPSRFEPSPASIAECTEELASRGFDTVVTSALSSGECDPFRMAGFTNHHELHLLAHHLRDVPPLSDLPPTDRRQLRRAWQRDWPQVLSVDEAAFNGFWQFDEAGLEDALAATPVRRFRVTKANPVVGYHISGIAGAVGYLQRLAVDPSIQGQGIGSRLLTDALSWMTTRGATIAYVNTQVGNDSALALYERRGFVLQDERLTVLTRTIGKPSEQLETGLVDQAADRQPE